MRKLDLVSDCTRCQALCCIATCFDASEDFAFSKAAGVPCPHLNAGARCSIHSDRLARGFSGCTLYECYGAGQRVTHACDAKTPAARRNATFLTLRDLHEMLVLLTGASELLPSGHSALSERLAEAVEVLDARGAALTEGAADLDMSRDLEHARALLREVGMALGGR